MISGNKEKWIKKEISQELNQEVEGKIKSYYCWKMATAGENYAHIFISEFKTTKELENNWENIVNQVALLVQSEQDSLLERSNFYVWFFVEEEIPVNLQKRIEDDTYSSQKFVVSGEKVFSITEQLRIIQSRLFTFDFDTEKSLKKMIAKVELENFRIYKGKKTFDFEREDGAARLVVLYAPNGTGKTSFFDGVEWNLTGNVDRFGTIGNKSISGEILKNTEADSEESASVCVHFNDGECIKRNVSRLNKKTKKDNGVGSISIYPENELKDYVGNVERWKNLILQHHKIDGFIAATKPQALYEEWGSLWDPDNKRRNIFEESYRKKKKEEKELEIINTAYIEIAQKFSVLEQGRNFAEKLSGYVELFQKLSGKEILGNWDFQVMSAEEYVKWSDQVNKEIDWYQKQNVVTDALIQYIQKGLSLDNEQYQIMQCQRKDNLKRQRYLSEKLQSCYRKKQLLVEKENLENQKEQLKQQSESYHILKNQGETWFEQAKKYLQTKKIQQFLQENMINYEKEIITLEEKRDKLQLECCKKENSIKEDLEYHRLCSHLEELEGLKQEQENLNKQIQECISSKEQVNDQGLKIEETIQSYKNKKFGSFTDALQAYDSEILGIPDDNTKTNEKAQELYKSLQDYAGQRKKVEEVTQSILAEEKVEGEVQQILLETRKVIEKQNSRVCPVCNTVFESSNELMENTYRIISVKAENLKKQRKEQEIYLENIKQQCLKNVELYQNAIDEIIAELEDKIQQVKKTYEEKRALEDNLRMQLKQKQERMEQIPQEDQKQGLYAIYTKDGIESWHDLWKTKQDKELKELKNDLEQSKKQLQLCRKIQEEEKQSIKEKQEFLLKVANEMKESFSILQKTETLIEEYSYSEIDQKDTEYEKKREEFVQKLENVENELNVYQEVIVSMADIYQKEITDLQQEIHIKEEMTKKLLEQMQKVFTEKDESDFKITEEDIRIRKEELDVENQKNQQILDVLECLKYNNEVKNYFAEWKKMQQTLKNTLENKVKQEVVAENAEKTYQEAKETIQQEMQEFLRQFQVSDIYEKLEPHEELKTLVSEFCFNDDGKPELSFQVSDKTGKTYPPEWYFSTAQLNVVAFSVFLGRALQAEDEPIKSILIDDPVGHFDDMNIVGFVNLLRNIIENTDRQLIISTHEERVFGLIQRKIPQEEYPVKYIDLRKEV